MHLLLVARSSLSHHEEGSVWLEEPSGQREAGTQGPRNCGSMYRITFQALYFQAHRQLHCTCEWNRANRITLSAYCIGTYQHLSETQKGFLADLGFLLPSS